MSNKESHVQKCIRSGNVEGLLSILRNEQDWMVCFDAAEGLAQLGNGHGKAYLLEALQDRDEEKRAIAREILDGLDSQTGNPTMDQMQVEHTNIETKMKAANREVEAMKVPRVLSIGVVWFLVVVGCVMIGSRIGLAVDIAEHGGGQGLVGFVEGFLWGVIIGIIIATLCACRFAVVIWPAGDQLHPSQQNEVEQFSDAVEAMEKSE